MSKTSIEWCDFSINPIRARNKATGKVGHFCEKVSPGCANCYASTWNEERFGTGLPFIEQHSDAVELFLDESKLAEVLRRKKPTTYFWCDMTDMFYLGVRDEWIDRCFATMALTPQHTHQVLTKRADRMAHYMEERGYHAYNDVRLETEQWPPRNVWLGVSVEDKKRKERIDVLRQIPAAVRFLSLEPLLEDLGELDLTGIHWMIIGGESGEGSRPNHLESVRTLIRQGKAASVAVFNKQLGANVLERIPDAPVHVELLAGLQSGSPDVYKRLKLKHPKGGDPSEWPEDLRVREFPKGL